MQGNPLSAATVYLGWNGGQKATVLNVGPITAGNLYVGNSSTLTLAPGVPMTLTGTLDVEQNSTLNMQGNPLSAATVYLGLNGGQKATVLNVGPITAGSLYVVNSSTLTLAPGAPMTLSYSIVVDSGSTLNMGVGGTLSANNVTVADGSTLTLGASTSLGGALWVDPTSTLNMHGNPLTAFSVSLGVSNGTAATVLGRAGITTNFLMLTGQAFNLVPADTVTNFQLGDGTSTLAGCVSSLTLYNGSQAATVSANSLSGNAYVESGSTLTLGAPLALSGALDVEGYSTLDMGGQPLSAPYVYLGWWYGQPVNVLNRRPIATGNLFVAAGTLDLSASDAVTNFSLSNGTSTLSSSVSSLSLSNSAQAITTVAGGVSGSVSLLTGSTLTLQAPLTLSGQFDMEQYSTLNMQGHSLSAASVYLGWEGYGQPVNLWASGAVTANILGMGSNSALTLTSGSDLVKSQITLSQNSTLTVQPSSVSGLTFNGPYASALTVNDTSALQLTAGGSSGPSWLFRWQDPAGGNWQSTLSGLITAGGITITPSAGYSLFDEEGYTYIAAGSTLVWNGGGGNTSWSNSANWGGATPSAGQWLRFAALASGGTAASYNNIPGNPNFYGIFFDSQAPSYNLQGNAIQLCGDVLNQSGNDQTISLDMQLVPGNGAFNTDTVTFDTGGKNITVAGSISGAGMALLKTGSGTLILSGSDNYTGGTLVDAGMLLVTDADGIPAGSSLTVGSGGTVIFTPAGGSAMEVSHAGAIAPVPEPGTLALLAVAGMAAAVAAWRRRRS